MDKIKEKFNLIGLSFGRLTVIEYAGYKKDNSYVWKCLCSCGKEHFANSKHLKRGSVKSCGCLQYEPNKSKGRPYKGEDLAGKRFGKLLVIKYVFTDKFQQRKWECLCDCGNIKYVSTGSLNQGQNMSCGCMGYKSGNRKAELIYNYKGYKDISGSRWYQLENGAKTRNLEFSITKEQVWDLFEKQNRKCYFSGIPLSFKDSTASVDRLDPSKGYIIENIAIIHKDINRIKSNLSTEYFIEICQKITNFYLNEKGTFNQNNRRL